MVGVVGAIMAFVGASATFAFQVPNFYATDERAHVGYAHAIAGGNLPEIDDPLDIPADATQWRSVVEDDSTTDSYRTVWVANHPPLNYLLVTPLIWLSNTLGRSDGGLLFMRFANIAFAAVGIAFTYLLGFELTGGRRIGLAAACLVAFLPRGHYEFALGLNDGLGFAAVTAVAWAATRYIRRGHSTRGLILLGGTIAVAAGTRAAAMLAALGALTIVVVARFVSTKRGARLRMRAAAVTLAVAVLPAVILTGWFYIRNVVLYGDIGASSYLLERFDRVRRGSVLEIATWGHRWVNMYETLSTKSLLSAPFRPLASKVAVVVAVLAAGGLIVVMAMQRTGDHSSVGARWRISRWALLVNLTVVVVIAATVVQHAAGGGSFSNRYLLPTIGVLAVLFVVGLDRVVPRLLPVAVIVALALSTAHFVPARVAGDIDAGYRVEPVPLSRPELGFVLATSITGVLVLVVVFVSTVRASPRLVGSARSVMSRRGAASGYPRGG